MTALRTEKIVRTGLERGAGRRSARATRAGRAGRNPIQFNDGSVLAVTRSAQLVPVGARCLASTCPAPRGSFRSGVLPLESPLRRISGGEPAPNRARRHALIQSRPLSPVLAGLGCVGIVGLDAGAKSTALTARISLRRQPGSDTTQDFAKSFGSVAPLIVGVRHAQQHEDAAWKSPGTRRAEKFTENET